MPSSPNLHLRPATRADLDLILDWAAGEGWNPGPHDADAFWAADPHGYLLAELDCQIIGGGSVVKYDDRLGFMGLFIVKPEFRGRGLGREIWHRRRDHLRARLDPDHGAIGLDGVVAMQPFYARGGFQLLQSATRHFGPVASSPAAEALPDGVRLVPLLELPFAQVERFDRNHFGASRPGFLEAWLRAPGTLALGAVDEADGTLLAMGCRRPGGSGGYKLGPLFARDERVADAVFRALTREVEAGANVYLDVPEWNPAAMSLARRYGLVPQFTCGRMYLGPAPELPWGEIYGVTSFELG